MKIGIHYEHEKVGYFNESWIKYCEQNNLKYKLVNVYRTDIIDQLADCNALMWHHDHGNYKDLLFAKQLIFSLEQCGKKVFPDSHTCWHFDDKLGQKYLFEAIGAPLVPTYVFYSKQEAIKWVDITTFPKVFKLRRGAGSANVKLVKTANQAHSLINQAFGKGFSQFDRLGYFKDRLNKYLNGKVNLLEALKGFGRLFIGTQFSKLFAPEKGYIYFQDFIPDNLFDIRVIVIADKAFAIKRMVRKDDFRASGSGSLLYEKEHFPIETISLAFQLTDKLQSQCAAFDFVYDSAGNPMVVEVSFGFGKGYGPCVGHWDKSLQFHEGAFNPEYWMIEALVKNL